MNSAIRYITLTILVAFAAIAVAAQDERNKFEFFGGYAIGNFDNVNSAIDNAVDPKINMQGFNTSITGNVSKYIGIKFDYALLANNQGYQDADANVKVKYRSNQFLGGIQFKDNSKDGPTFKPFGHVLAGMANQQFELDGTFINVVTPTPKFGNGTGTTRITAKATTNNFSMVLGGGLDIKVSKRIDIRAVQFDYNPIFFKQQTIGGFNYLGATQNNIRLAFGIVIH